MVPVRSHEWPTSDGLIYHATADFDCIGCGADTAEIGEWYAVRADAWPLDPSAGCLCIGCLEQRLGRTLTARDFIDTARINTGWIERSARLVDRVHGVR